MKLSCELVADKHKLDLCHLSFEVIVTNNIQRSYGRRNPKSDYDAGDCIGLCTYGGYRWGIYLHTKLGVDHDTIAHEVFHLTHHILKSRNIKFRVNEHETHASLAGVIANCVYKSLKKRKVRVKVL